MEFCSEYLPAHQRDVAATGQWRCKTATRLKLTPRPTLPKLERVLEKPAKLLPQKGIPVNRSTVNVGCKPVKDLYVSLSDSSCERLPSALIIARTTY